MTLSNELIHILSEQMYRSPIKAIEELVVNSYDADARECRLLVPLPPSDKPHVLVFDDGHGMNADGLEDLWHIGRSNKRAMEIEKRSQRKQIGKFGIGKLATYAIADLVTYISKSDEGIRGVTVDFGEFAKDPTGGKPITLKVRELTRGQLEEDDRLKSCFSDLEISVQALRRKKSWTLVILESLKPKMGRIRRRDLNWVLSTAMPLGSDFKLRLNGEQIDSQKASYETIVAFDVASLPKARLDTLEQEFGVAWRVDNGRLVSATFPSGVAGTVIVTKQSLYTGKSSDLARSHGFFVRVRSRLVDEADPLFGIEPLSYEVFNRFRADLVADDLDAVVTAPREGFEASDEIREFQKLLVEIFYEARAQYQAKKRAAADKERRKREDEQDHVQPDIVELPLADALTAGNDESEGGDADDTWFYVRLPAASDLPGLIESLYGAGRKPYTYADIEGGRSGRLVQLDPASATFYVNVDHPVVQAHDDPFALPLLQDMLAAEVMLEVYLRSEGVPTGVIGDLLERRDLLLRGLATDHLRSVTAIAAALRTSTDDEHDLEVNLVLAARALGFVAKHIAGAGRADGVARYTEYPGGERKIILEAKSSEDVPSLGAIDFGGLHQHMLDEAAEGCLLVAPSYPGTTRSEDAQAAKRAVSLRISCWTVEQLASVVEAAESRHIAAADLLAIVTTAFAPEDVRAAVSDLLSDPTWITRELYGAVIDALRELEGRLRDRPRTIDQIAGEVTRKAEFRQTEHRVIKSAVYALVSASQGLLRLVGVDRVQILGDYDELERRTSQLTGRTGRARRSSTFKASD